VLKRKHFWIFRCVLEDACTRTQTLFRTEHLEILVQLEVWFPQTLIYWVPDWPVQDRSPCMAGLIMPTLLWRKQRPKTFQATSILRTITQNGRLKVQFVKHCSPRKRRQHGTRKADTEGKFLLSAHRQNVQADLEPALQVRKDSGHLANSNGRKSSIPNIPSYTIRSR
jgi:hypothetical protein